MKIHGLSFEVEVQVALNFTASHELPARPELHAHLWEVEFSVAGEIDPATGMVCDMLKLDSFFRPFIEPLDQCNLHRYGEFLGSTEPMIAATATHPTCDTLARYFLWKILPAFRAHPELTGLRLSQIKVSIWEPDMSARWGNAVIRPQGR